MLTKTNCAAVLWPEPSCRCQWSAGQQLQVNDLIVVLEAMKMETAITAPVEGKLKSINVAPGEAVKANQVLVEFD